MRTNSIIRSGLSPLALAKERVTIPTLAANAFPGWKPGKSCKSPFRDDRHPSFAVYDEGRRWKDFATGEGGDVVDFLAKISGGSKGDAARQLIAMAGTGGMRRWPKAKAVSVPDAPTCKPEPPKAMPEEIWQTWQEGVAHLRGNASLQRQIEGWRSWPEGTLAALIEDEVVGTPIVHGRRGVAFVVQYPFTDDVGAIGVRHIGFHFRHKPNDEDRATWSYHPSGAKIPALPFVTGAGDLPFATTIVITEGQWDSITLAAAAGWLASEAGWPEGISVFGVRGAASWRHLITTWSPYWRKDARFVVFRDSDEAGGKWLKAGGLVETLQRTGKTVDVLCSNVGAAKDLNDLLRLHPFGRDEVETWIRGGL